MAMQKVKERMNAYKDKIDEMEEREHDAKLDLKEAEAKAEQNEKEADGIRRRIILLKTELEKTLDRLGERSDKLERIESNHQSIEELRKEMEESEMEVDEKIQHLEEALNDAQLKEEESGVTLVDAERRYQKVEEDYLKEEAKVERLHARIAEQEDIIERANGKMSELEKNDEEASEREELSCEKVQFLEEQLKQTIDRAEESERRCGQLERFVETTSSEIASWASKKEEILCQMNDLTDIADDLEDV